MLDTPHHTLEDIPTLLTAELRAVPSVEPPIDISKLFISTRGRYQAATEGVISQTASVPVDNSIYPRKCSEAVERIAEVDDLYFSGDLHNEVERLGVSIAWLDRYHNQRRIVAIDEQLMPLPTLFCKLGEYGGPNGFVEALSLIRNLRQEFKKYLESADCSEQDEIGVGMISSQYNLVSKRGMTSGFYLIVPDLAKKDESLTRLKLYSANELSRLERTAYKDLTLSPDKIENIVKEINACTGALRKMMDKSINAYRKQANFNERLRQEGREVTEEMVRNYEMHSGNAENAIKQELASVILGANWHDTLNALRSPNGEISYCDFVASLNRKFVSACSSDIVFETFWSDAADNLASGGVTDWKKFLEGFLRADLIAEDEPVFRYRKELQSNGKYQILKIHRISGDDITLEDRSTGERYSLDRLSKESQISLIKGEGPTLIPIAMVRYWVNYAISNSIILEDGMPYRQILRLDRAMSNPSFTQNPRKLTIVPYTRLPEFCPADSESPYADLKEMHSSFDYLAPGITEALSCR